MCKNHPAHFWPMLPSRSGPDANRIRHVYWDHYILLIIIISSNLMFYIHYIIIIISIIIITIIIIFTVIVTLAIRSNVIVMIILIIVITTTIVIVTIIIISSDIAGTVRFLTRALHQRRRGEGGGVSSGLEVVGLARYHGNQHGNQSESWAVHAGWLDQLRGKFTHILQLV